MCERAYMLVRQKACVDGGWGIRRTEEKDKIQEAGLRLKHVQLCSLWQDV